MEPEKIRRKLSQERTLKARSIIRAAHQLLQTYDLITIMSMCQEIRCRASELYQHCATIRLENNNKSQCADEPTVRTGPQTDEDFVREGMEGL